MPPRSLITDDNVIDGGRYFRPQSALDFIPSGCRLLDCVLGGGWALTRISNVVGDFSTGKTLLAIEATANFARKYPKGRIRYAEAEAAFDQSYAASIGMPIDRVEFTDEDFLTITDFYNDLTKFLSQLGGEPGLYILDSLDAMSSVAEQEKDFGKGDYGTKAKDMGKLLKDCVKFIKKSNAHLMIISQERDNIGVMFGKKSTRSGGRALDFYASQVLWLAKKKTIEQTVNKLKRAVGLEIKAKVEKNKISVPLGVIDFNIRFSFGVDDFTSCLDWLEEVGYEKKVFAEFGVTKKSELVNHFNGMSNDEYWEQLGKLGDMTIEAWTEVEDSFRPERSRA